MSRCAQLDEPWARSRPAGLIREAIGRGLLGPQLAYFLRRRTIGRERLASLPAPVVFVANHASHIDTPIILRSLPRAWRRRTVVAAAADYFYKDRKFARLVSLVFNTVPVMREGGGTGEMEHVHQLVRNGWSVLVYPEGTRSVGGQASRLRTGAAVLAAHHGVPLVPIHLTGTREAMPRGQMWPWRWPWARRFPVEVTFGEPIRPAAPEERRDAIERVQAFFDAHEPVGAAQR